MKVSINLENYLRDFGNLFKIPVIKSYIGIDFKINFTNKKITPWADIYC
jgi:hypothetical protein